LFKWSELDHPKFPDSNSLQYQLGEIPTQLKRQRTTSQSISSKFTCGSRTKSEPTNRERKTEVPTEILTGILNGILIENPSNVLLLQKALSFYR
jgi:hypothetical protein